MKSILCVAAVSAACVLASPAAAHPEDGAINAVYANLARARTAHDVAGMTAAFAPDGLLIDARPGPAISGAELGARLEPMAARLRSEGHAIATAYRIERRSVSGDVAMDAGYMRQTITRPDGEAFVRHARFLVTLRRSPDGWRILGDAAMPATEAQWAAATPVEGLHHDG